MYPVRRQLVRVTSRVGAAYFGYVQQYATSLRNRESCYIFEANSRDLRPGVYDGILVGSHQGLPLYHVSARCCAGTPGSSSFASGTSSLMPGASSQAPGSLTPSSLTPSSLVPSSLVPSSISASLTSLFSIASHSIPSLSSASNRCEILGCGGCDMPRIIPVTVSGITNGACGSCTSVNGQYLLVNQPPNLGGSIGCTWYSNPYDSGCGSVTGPIRLYYNIFTNSWSLEMGIGANGGLVGVLQGTWQCDGINTFIISDGVLGEYCRGPVTIVVDVRCSGGTSSRSSTTSAAQCSSQTYTLPGTYQYTVQVEGTYQVNMWGGGQGGSVNSAGSVSGGKGATCSTSPVSLAVGNVLTIVVGAGGAGANGGSFNNGGDTELTLSSLLFRAPGGGSASSPNGTVIPTTHAGGAGGNSGIINGGGGGGAGGTLNNGSNGANDTGLGTAAGGAGGTVGGGNGGDATPQNGFNPGGGGGGNGTTVPGAVGGNGGNGRVEIVCP